MAVIKCKMCGGSLQISEDSSVCECEYCGTKQTVPKADDEKKLTLFARAGKLLRGCEFDKAAGVFESIVADFPEEAEAYWGLVLCKYGIEYVDDPATGKKVPTCHRSSFDSVEDDANFEQACENADAIARRVYRDEARQIEGLRKKILEVSGREEPYDVFISYKETDEEGERTPDSVIAQDIYKALTNEGYRVFFSRISLEGKLGVEYEPYIFAALNSAKVLLAVGTDYEYYDAVWVKNEWSRFLKLIAAGQPKTLIPVYKDMDPYDMPKELRGLAAQNMGKLGAMQDLLHGIEKIVGKKKPEPAPQQVIQQTVVQGGVNLEALLKRGFMSLEDNQWDKATELFDKVLNDDPENAQAYLGLLLAENRLREPQEIASAPIMVNDGKINGKARVRIANFGSEKVKVIKEVEIITGAGLAEAKKTVEDGDWFAVYERQAEALRQCGAVLEIEGYSEAKGTIGAIESSAHFKRFMRFTKQPEAEKIRGYLAEAKARAEEKARRDAEEARRKAEEQRIAREKAAEEWRIAQEKKAEEERLAKQRHLEELKQKRERAASVSKMFSVASSHSVGLKSDGTVIATKIITSYYFGDHGQCNIGTWKNIVAVSAGFNHTVGLRDDGTVLATGSNDHGQCDVGAWKNIIDVSAGNDHTVGLRADGTVVATKYKGDYYFGQCDVGDWRDIVAISAGCLHTLGLKADGTVVAKGDNRSGECDVGDWRDIVAVSAGDDHSIGLKANGTVVAAGENDRKQCEVGGWRDIVAIAAGREHTVGLKADGTVVATSRYSGYPDPQCKVQDWRDIVAIAAGEYSTLGIKADGTLISVYKKVEFAGFTYYGGQCEVGSWKLFGSIDTLEDERKAAAEKAEAERKAAAEKAEAKRKARIAALSSEKRTLQAELANLRGLFTGKRRREIEARLAEIEAELKKLG